MIRRYGDRVDPATRYRPRPGAYVILELDGELLLTVEALNKVEVQLPGGGVDPGEHPIPALHREVLEETGWRMGAPRRIGVFRRYAYMPEYDLWAEKICTIYHARPTVRVGPPLEPHHIPLWCPVTDAPRLLGVEGDAAFVAAFFRLPDRPVSAMPLPRRRHRDRLSSDHP